MKGTVNEKIDIYEVLAGVWHNQHNSELHLEVDRSGKIVGFFINDDKRQSGKPEWYPLTGFARGVVFAFCVDFAKHGCMTTWVGQIVNPHTRSFTAMWQMVSDTRQRPDLSWKSISVGEDTFTAGPRLRPAEFIHEDEYPPYCSLV